MYYCIDVQMKKFNQIPDYMHCLLVAFCNDWTSFVCIGDLRL